MDFICKNLIMEVDVINQDLGHESCAANTQSVITDINVDLVKAGPSPGPLA
jgi:hypothetical protein